MSEAVYVFTYFLFTCFTHFLLFFVVVVFYINRISARTSVYGSGGGCLRASVCVCVREGERE